MAFEPVSEEAKRLVDQYLCRQERQRKEQKCREFRSKIICWFTIAGLLLLCLVLWKGPGWYWEFAKRQMAFRFLQAVLIRDGQTLYELTAPEERERLRLTPEKAVVVMERLLAYLGEVKPVRVEIEKPPLRLKDQTVKGPGGVEYRIIYSQNPAFPEERTWVVYWGDQTGRLLPSWWAQFSERFPQENYMTSKILIVKLKSGFWVDFGYFVLSTCTSKWGKEGLRMTERIWREANLIVKEKR